MKSIVSSLLHASVIPDFMDRLQKNQAWWEKRQIRSERIQCPAVQRDIEAQNGQQIQLNLFNHNTFVFVCSHSRHLFLNSSVLTSLAHRRYRRGAEIKVPLTHRRPSHPFLRHSNLSHSLFQVFDCNFLVFEIDVFCLFFAEIWVSQLRPWSEPALR